MRRYVPDVMVEPQAERERQFFHAPLILGVEAHVAAGVLFAVRRRPLGDADRRAVPERVAHVAVAENELIGEQLLRLKAGLERVRPGHIRGRDALRLPVGVVRAAAVG